jgi:DNA-directed RNA polymerase subunit beta'
MMNNRNNNKDKNPVKRFNKISIGLASPESILKESSEVLKPRRSTTVHTSLSVTVFSVKIFGPVRF